jgi:transposase-like protein
MAKKPPAARRTPVKEAHHVLQDALLKAGQGDGKDGQLCKHGEIAKSLGVSASMLYKWREPAEKGSGQPNPLHRTALLIKLTGDTRIVDWLAQRAGGQFTPVESEVPNDNLDKAANALVREFGLLIADVADAIEDHRITADETQELREKWDRIRKRTEAFVRRCEKDDFRPKG